MAPRIRRSYRRRTTTNSENPRTNNSQGPLDAIHDQGGAEGSGGDLVGHHDEEHVPNEEAYEAEHEVAARHQRVRIAFFKIASDTVAVSQVQILACPR